MKEEKEREAVNPEPSFDNYGTIHTQDNEVEPIAVEDTHENDFVVLRTSRAETSPVHVVQKCQGPLGGGKELHAE